MAYTMSTLMNGIMSNPDVMIAGIAIGFIMAKFMGRRRNSMMGGGGLFP